MQFVSDGMTQEHEAIRAHLKLMLKPLVYTRPGSILEDQEIAERTGLMEWKIRQWQYKIDYLEEGLKKHFSREEDLLQPILGCPLMDAVLTEHQAIGKQLHKVGAMLSGDTDGESGSPPGMRSKYSSVRQEMEKLSEMIESHTIQEDCIEMLLQKLRERGLRVRAAQATSFK